MTVTTSGLQGDEVRAHRNGHCYVCGYDGAFELRCRSPREGFLCPRCRASLRYQHQAQTIIDVLTATSVQDLSALATYGSWRDAHIYEPGVIGPFRKLFRGWPNYQSSYLWRDVPLGTSHEGVRCENLERLTFGDQTFDLVITSDIFEHVRKPWEAFQSVYRVLRPGGRHVMSIPTNHPLPSTSVPRVDTSTDEDRHIEPPVYHGSPKDKQGSLVYTDFGADLPSRLTQMGYEVSVHYGFAGTNTYVMRRPS